MRPRHVLLVVLAALVAGSLGLVASVALYGPGPLLRSELGQRLVSALRDNGRATGPRVIALDDAAPPFSLPDLAGTRHTYPRPGRPLLVNYWATWCAPCRTEMPLLDAYSRNHRNDIDVVAIALDSPEDVAAFLARHPVSFPTLIEAPGEHDSSASLGNLHGVLPFSVLISADGRLLKRSYGAFANQKDLIGWAAAAR